MELRGKPRRELSPCSSRGAGVSPAMPVFVPAFFEERRQRRPARRRGPVFDFSRNPVFRAQPAKANPAVPRPSYDTWRRCSR